MNMQFIVNFFQKHRDKTVLGFLVLLSLILLVLPENTRISVGEAVLNVLLLPAAHVTHWFDDYVDMRDENRRLKRMVASLMHERERLLQYREEREYLRRLAGFREEQFYNLVSAEVIGRNLDRFQTNLIIDKGENDGLKPKMPVVSYQGYVGRVYRVFPSSAWVQLICSKNTPVSCVDKRSRVVGIVEWRRRNTFDLTSVSAVEDVEVGDTLLTSGFGGVVPKGFFVATVTKTARASDGLTLKVEARSEIKFRSLEEVFVLTDRIPWNRGILYDRADTMLVNSILGDSL